MRLFDPAGVYTPTEVISALEGRSGVRNLVFRFERLNAQNKLIGEIQHVADAEVSNNALADIKRTFSFSVSDDQPINYLSDRIKPYAGIRMPDGGYVWWSLGVFLMSSPSRPYRAGGLIMRDVDAYDQLLVLRDDKVTDRYTIAAGTNYITAINSLVSGLGFTVNATPTTKTLPVARDWDPGTSRLEILNELLTAVNYESAFFDEEGTLVCRPYKSPADRASEYTYVTGPYSLIGGEVEQTIDLFAIPNKWTVVVSNADQTPISATYTNSSVSSPTSTVNRGRTIVDFRTEQDIADQATLNAFVARLAFEASQVYEIIEFETPLMPVHQNGDVYSLDIPGMDVLATYSEHTWSLPLQVGAMMGHKIRRVVTVS